MFKLLLVILLFSCNKETQKKFKSINDYLDNELTGSPLMIEISEDDKLSIEIQSDTLYKYDTGDILMFGGVYADLYNSDGVKSSELHSDSAIIYNNSDSVRANGNIIIETINGKKLLTTEITLYNESFSNMLRNNSMILNERTDVFVKGLSGSEEIEAAGGEYRFTLDYIVPMKLKGDTLDIFPDLKTKVDDQLEEVDLDDPNTKITIIDKRKGKEKEKEEEVEPKPKPDKKKKKKKVEKVKTSMLAKIPSYKGLDMGTLKKMAKAIYI